MRKGKTFIITGPSGVGKGTIIAKLFEGRDDLYFSVSATTRDPRPGEVDGVHYHFLTHEQFREWIDRGEFLEYAEFVDNSYGTPRRFVDEAMAAGKDAILDIEVQGAEQIHALRPEAIRIFIAPPSWEELERRLVGRGTEDAEKIRKRLARSRIEWPLAKEYDYIVVNHTVEQAVNDVRAILAAERCRAAEQYELVGF